ncbi:MAG: hypothetical protein ACRD6W_02695 [Nitrososphaerales archaeon]
MIDDRSTLLARTKDDIDRYLAQIGDAAARAAAWLAAQSGDPLDMLRRIKFDAVGCHPIDSRALNLVEQVNQTWTYAVALTAAQRLLVLHPEAGGYRLSPGAHAAAPLDIMSEAGGLVGAETFAAVDRGNNKKLVRDLAKMALRPERHRYVFFLSPKYPGTRRHAQLERNGVQVWSVDV